jgi:hypothetical protein
LPALDDPILARHLVAPIAVANIVTFDLAFRHGLI